MLNDIYNGADVDQNRLETGIGLFRLDFARPAAVRPGARRCASVPRPCNDSTIQNAHETAESADEFAARARHVSAQAAEIDRWSRIAGRSEDMGLAEGALLIAAEEYRDLDIGQYVNREQYVTERKADVQ